MTVRRASSWIAVVALLAIAAGCQEPPPPIDLSGPWAGSYTADIRPGEVYDAALTVQQTGSSLSGWFSASSGRVASLSGKVSGTGVTFTETFTDGCAGTAKGQGTVTDDATRVTGSYTADDCVGHYSGSFDYRRQSTSGPVASVTVTPASASLAVGATLQLSAMPRDAGGNPLPAEPVTWASDDEAVASVSETGVVTGNGEGSARVTATAGAAHGAATVTVTSAPGILEVTTSTTGQNLDADGYEVTLDDAPALAIDINATASITGVDAGSHDVRLAGVAGNCQVGGDNPQSVTVPGGGTVQVTFDVVCTTTVGRIQVTTTTGGADLDPDGYTLTLDGGLDQHIGRNATLTLDGIAEGVHTLTLTGVALNCSVGDGNAHQATVTAGQTAHATFAVTCLSTMASIGVAAATTGESLDPDGYAVVVDGGPGQHVDINGSVLIPVQGGEHQVELTGVASNCMVSGNNPRTVAVSAGATALVTFEVQCHSLPGEIQVSTSTQGAAFDPDGFTVNVDGGPFQPIAPVATLTFGGLSAGSHQVLLAGLSALCAVDGGNPRNVSVPAGGTGSVTFPVTCAVPPSCEHDDIEPTPPYSPYRDLMARVTPAGPVFATSSEAVPVCALTESGYMLGIMLRNRPDVAVVLRSQGTLTAVIGRSQSVCDLPYFSDLAQTDPGKCDDRGLGGVPLRDATACSEENLLKYAADPYGRGTRDDGENTCVHELGHTTMNLGLSQADRDAIQQRYQAVLNEGLWHDAPEQSDPSQRTAATFALTSVDEFWAEMTQVYFCANPAVPSFLHNGVNCADQLEVYDPQTFRLVDGIYRGAADLR